MFLRSVQLMLLQFVLTLLFPVLHLLFGYVFVGSDLARSFVSGTSTREDLCRDIEATGRAATSSAPPSGGSMKPS